MLEQTITDENIRKFVVLFYSKTIEDKVIGHYFVDILGEDLTNKEWSEHIDILTDFWASMILGRDNYSGSPFSPHIQMQLKREDFQRWLEVLDETLNEIYERKASEPFREIGTVISRNFMRNLGL